jgi:hypothetical protein
MYVLPRTFSDDSALSASASGKGVSVYVTEYAPELSNTKSNGKIRSVSDIPGTTVILTLMGKIEDRYLILRSFDIKFKTGQSIHCEGPFERTKGMGWEPAYRYTFPAQEE